VTTLEILKAARELLAVPERWTKGSGARNALGNPVSAYSLDPACFCMSGAIAHITGAENYSLSKDVRNALNFRLWSVLHIWNDAPERTHAEVLARFDEAIARLEGAATP